MSRRLLAGITIVCVALGCAVALGVGIERARWNAVVAETKAQADSLRGVLRNQVAVVVRDTVRVDSIVTRWRRLVDTVEMPSPPETLTVERIVRVADSAVTSTAQAHRICVSALLECERAVNIQRERAEFAEAALAKRLTVDRRWSKAKATGVGVCVGSLGKQLFDVFKD